MYPVPVFAALDEVEALKVRMAAPAAGLETAETVVILAPMVCRVLPSRGEESNRALSDAFLARRPLGLCPYLEPVKQIFRVVGNVTVEVSGHDSPRRSQTDLRSTNTTDAHTFKASIVGDIDDVGCGKEVS